MLILLGVAVVVVGFAIRLNPLLVVALSAFVTGWLAHLSPLQVLAAFGKAFNDNRQVSAALLLYPLVGVLERAGLQERARMLIARFRGVSASALLIGYLAFRQVTAALGLISIAGQAPTVRPLLAPMAEGAAEARHGPLDDAARQSIRAQAAATDNNGVFFGEDIFLALGSVLLMVGFLASSGIVVEPLRLSLWAIPSALAAFVVHGARLALFERRLKRAARP
ncbi:MAG: hypothetical protein JWO72_2527 [Caulobacteraceae bacterium]|nr:hypothetical protein [Caulobacteraceae bacterium]